MGEISQPFSIKLKTMTKKVFKLDFDLEKLVDSMLASAYESVQYKIQQAISNAKDSKLYGYIPTGAYTLVPIIQNILENNPDLSKIKFMDIGCGYPIIPKIMQILNCKEAKGLEIQDIYVNLDRSNTLIKGDILKYNFKEYDILYAYNPIRDQNLMDKGLERIVKTMKPGATFYFANAGHPKTEVFKLFKGYGSYWKYIKPKKLN